jgi:GNAT superfamily N-acetyltransferase
MRPAEYSDIPEILRMGREFAKAIGKDVNREVLVPHLEGMINSEQALLAVDDGAMVAGILYPSYLDGEVTAQELWYWVDPDKRKQGKGKALIETFETWATAMGATVLLLTATHGMTHRVLGKIYSARGYKPQEHVYSKGI